MSENRVDRVTISKEAQVGKPSGAAPSWIPPVLKRFYEFTKNMAHAFSKETNQDREEELIKVVSKSFKGDI